MKKRRRPIRRSNPERKARVRGDKVYGSYHRWMEGWPCLLLSTRECSGVIKGEHIKTVGAGGKDMENEVPLCTYHRNRRHTMGIKTFARHYNVDLEVASTWYWRLYLDPPRKPSLS